MKSNWNSDRMLIRKRLTDKQIEAYKASGWYSVEYRQARKERMDKARLKREGNFLKSEAGALIFSPT